MKKALKILLPIVLVLMIASGIVLLAGSTYQPEAVMDNVERQFAANRISGVQYNGIFYHEDLGTEFLSYSGEDAAYTYLFDPETGKLLQIEDADGEYPEDGRVFSEAQRLEAALGLIFPWVENSLIGELQVVQHNQIGTSWHLIWEEFYQEQATGTRISVICSSQGHIRYCTIRYGAVFTKNAAGEIVLTDTRPLLDEDEAVRIAHTAVEEAFAERDFTQTLLPEKTVCTLKANEESRFYCVEVFSNIEELPYEGNYQVIIDPYDGTVQEVARNN